MKSDFLTCGSNTIIGMVHCRALPSTFGFDGNYSSLIEKAVEDALTLEKSGFDAIIVENMGDVPFSAYISKTQTAALAVIAHAVKKAIRIPVGIDAAFSDYEASLSIAAMIGASFVRIPVFVDTVVFTDGVIYPCAKKCMEHRRLLGKEDIRILADIQVKHAHMLLPHIPIAQSAVEAADCGADGVIITGSRVGEETPIEMIRRVKEKVHIPVLAGSGVNTKNIRTQMSIADGAIIGSGLKEGGQISQPVSYPLARKLMECLRA